MRRSKRGSRSSTAPLSSRPTTRLHIARAAAYFGLGRLPEAEADYRRAIELAPNEWRFMQELGEMLMATDRVKDAGPFLKQAGEMRVKEIERSKR